MGYTSRSSALDTMYAKRIETDKHYTKQSARHLIYTAVPVPGVFAVHPAAQLFYLCPFTIAQQFIWQ